ncbi:MAG: hypothetical protein RLZZ350_312 [Verrucomicrobiota bacterium]
MSSADTESFFKTNTGQIFKAVLPCVRGLLYLRPVPPARVSVRGVTQSQTMSSTLTPSEAAQLGQTIEMFEVITQSQPQDCQSLEILKEAYTKLGREAEVIKTSKRIAEAYVQLGQLSSAILEYETILQRAPDDAEILAALKAIEGRASTIAVQPHIPESIPAAKPTKKVAAADKVAPTVEDGRAGLYKIFVDSRLITSGDFDLCWTTIDPVAPVANVNAPFIQTLADKGILPIDKGMKTLVDKARLGYMPLERYDADLDITRAFSRDLLRRWCILPFDRISKTILVATANPYNQQAMRELKEATKNRVVWYIAPPLEIMKNLQKVFR